MPAVVVTYGQKNEGILNLRGIDARRIVLLLDGIPVYEPYFGTFDLKTLPASNIASLQVTKGPSSVLYGPNTLGGIVNVITTRPSDAPRLNLNASYGQDKTWSAGIDGSWRFKRFAIAGTAAYQDSEGFSVPDQTEEGVVIRPGGVRTNSDFWRLNLGAKLYYYPSDSSEILVAGDLYKSVYGMPPALFTQRSRYWRFPVWDRSSLSVGGFFGLGKRSLLRFRAFTVNYYNALEQFKDSAMTVRQYRSTYDNTSAGAFALGEFELASGLNLKTSLNVQRDNARQQDDVNAPWLEYHHSTLSAAAETHFRFLDDWTLTAGLSLDTLVKFTGPSTTRLNPLLGLAYSPSESAEIHASWGEKIRFPNMRAMYSLGSGNPDLLSENGQAWELGGSYTGFVRLSASMFAYTFRNMIDTVTLMDGTRRYVNIGRAHINGFEIQAEKNYAGVSASLNYTHLDHQNDTDQRPLDVVPNNSLNINLSLSPLPRLRFNLFGLYSSRMTWYDSSSRKVLNVPEFFQMDAVAAYDLAGFEIFFKAANIFNAFYYTEPGFPWRGRYFEGGLRLKVF
jgi:outer membrane cobalamin receptor